MEKICYLWKSNFLSKSKVNSHLDGEARRTLDAMLRSTVGFLTVAERINVILSRAKQQLILIGDQAQFRVAAKAVHRLRVTQASDVEDQGNFWQVILNALTPSGPGGGVPSDPETPFTIGVDRLIGV